METFLDTEGWIGILGTLRYHVEHTMQLVESSGHFKVDSEHTQLLGCIELLVSQSFR